MTMIVYWCAAAAAGFYLFHLPVRASLEMNVGQENVLCLGVGVFGRTRLFHMEKKLTLSLFLPKRKKKKRTGFPFRCFKYLANRGRIRKFSLRVGTQDAFVTALICGFFQAVLLPFVRSARIAPVFDARQACVRGLCIVDAQFGHIMIAALWSAAILLKRRVQTWIKGPSKAS